jgi:hypothetical protein
MCRDALSKPGLPGIINRIVSRAHGAGKHKDTNTLSGGCCHYARRAYHVNLAKMLGHTLRVSGPTFTGVFE